MYGWSGYEDGINIPAMQDIVGIGPIPRGMWVVDGAPFDSPHMGQYVLKLTPAVGTDTRGRNSFFIHGWAVSKPFDSSQGCVVLSAKDRLTLYQSADREFLVVA